MKKFVGVVDFNASAELIVTVKVIFDTKENAEMFAQDIGLILKGEHLFTTFHGRLFFELENSNVTVLKMKEGALEKDDIVSLEKDYEPIDIKIKDFKNHKGLSSGFEAISCGVEEIEEVEPASV